MKALFDFMDKKIAPLFEEGGKLEPMAPLFEAIDAFARTSDKVTTGAPHVRDSIDQKRLMIFVIYALIPCILFGIWNAGLQFNRNSGIDPTLSANLLRGAIMVLPIIFVSYLVGGFWEVLFAIVRKHEINEGFLVTGMLFPLVLPPTIPLWQVAAGISFGIVIGKEIFGGVGYNILNPALTGRAFLFFAYPMQISGDSVWVGSAVDAVTQATPLAIPSGAGTETSVVTALNTQGFDLWNMTAGTIPGCIAPPPLSRFCWAWPFC